MPVPTNTSPATATELTADVVNTTVLADVQLAPNGTGYTSNCRPSDPQRNALWYKYTPSTNQKYISFGVVGIPTGANYAPYANVWTGTPPGVTQYRIQNPVSLAFISMCGAMSGSASGTMYLYVPVTPGTTYYFQVQNDNSTAVDYDLSVIVKAAPVTQARLGS